MTKLKAAAKEEANKESGGKEERRVEMKKKWLNPKGVNKQTSEGKSERKLLEPALELCLRTCLGVFTAVLITGKNSACSAYCRAHVKRLR